MPWNDEEKTQIVQAVATVCEVTQTRYSTAAMEMILRALETHPHPAVLASLDRCASECKGRLSLADIVSRIDDGRPGADEAWAMMPKNERDAGCVTAEMSVAWGAAAGLYESDEIGARMAFREAYKTACEKNRAAGIPVKWSLSPGWDRAATEAAAIEGFKTGKLTARQAADYSLPEAMEQAQLPSATERANMARLAGMIAKQLADKNP